MLPILAFFSEFYYLKSFALYLIIFLLHSNFELCFLGFNFSSQNLCLQFKPLYNFDFDFYTFQLSTNFSTFIFKCECFFVSRIFFVRFFFVLFSKIYLFEQLFVRLVILNMFGSNLNSKIVSIHIFSLF